MKVVECPRCIEMQRLGLANVCDECSNDIILAVEAMRESSDLSKFKSLAQIRRELVDIKNKRN